MNGGDGAADLSGVIAEQLLQPASDGVFGRAAGPPLLSGGGQVELEADFSQRQLGKEILAGAEQPLQRAALAVSVEQGWLGRFWRRWWLDRQADMLRLPDIDHGARRLAGRGYGRLAGRQLAGANLALQLLPQGRELDQVLVEVAVATIVVFSNF